MGRIKKYQYNIKSKNDIDQELIQRFKRLINILITRSGVIDKIQQGQKDQILSHLLTIYPKSKQKNYNQNFYYTAAYHKLLYILYRKNKHVCYYDPGVQSIINKNVQSLQSKILQKQQMNKFYKYLTNKIIQLNTKFNKTYYLIIIKKICQFLQNPQDAPLKRRDIIQQIRNCSYQNGKKIPKNYIYRVFYVLKKNFVKWKKQYQTQSFNNEIV